MISIFSSRVPLMIGVGNHEYDYTDGGYEKDPSSTHNPSTRSFSPEWGNFGADSGGECGVPTSKRFVVPSTGNLCFWYSYVYATVTTIMISSEHDLSPGSEQYIWLEQELERVNRTETPWLIVESHRPMYMSEEFWSQNNVSVAMRHEFEVGNYDGWYSSSIIQYFYLLKYIVVPPDIPIYNSVPVVQVPS